MSLYDRVAESWGETNPQGVSKITHKNLGWISMPLRRKLRTGEVVDPSKYVAEAQAKVRLSKAERRALEFYAERPPADPVINFPWRVHPTLDNLVSRKLLREIPHPKYVEKRRYEITPEGKRAIGLTENYPNSPWWSMPFADLEPHQLSPAKTPKQARSEPPGTPNNVVAPMKNPLPGNMGLRAKQRAAGSRWEKRNKKPKSAASLFGRVSSYTKGRGDEPHDRSGGEGR